MSTLGAFVRRSVEGVPVIAVGIGPAPIPGLVEHGASLVATISAVPAGSGAAPESESPLLWIEGAERDIFAHVVDGFSAALASAEAELVAFLRRVDPLEEATILAYLPIPRAPFGARRFWAQDAALSRRLEDKSSPLLAEQLPGLRYVELGWPCDEQRWSGIEAELGTSELVVQSLGLHGGGAGTRIVRGYEDACRRLPALGAGPLRASAFVPGGPANVMGVVPATGPTIVLPPTVQLVRVDASGCPIYAGNRLAAEDFSAAERRAIAEEVRSLGERLGREGFVGPFGLDFLRDREGRHLYHDLNPRMNGAAGLLAEVVDGVDGADGVDLVDCGGIGENSGLSCSPLPLLLLAARDYDDSEVAWIESHIAAAAAELSRWRLFVATTVAEPRTIEAPPLSGRWRVDPVSLAVSRVDDALLGPVAADGPELVRLFVSLAPGSSRRPGERLVVGELSCGSSMGRALWRAHGYETPARLADALLGGGR